MEKLITNTTNQDDQSKVSKVYKVQTHTASNLNISPWTKRKQKVLRNVRDILSKSDVFYTDRPNVDKPHAFSGC